VIFPDATAQEAADIASISRLAACYSEAICRGAISEAVQVYVPDGVLTSSKSTEAVGHAAIASTIKEAINAFDFVYNSTLPGVIRVEGDRAWARFPITELARLADGTTLHFLGTYDDELRREPGGWRFTRRALHGMTLGRTDAFSRSRLVPIPGPPHGLATTADA
jgi:ketosteroid isomerase-like protein